MHRLVHVKCVVEESFWQGVEKEEVFSVLFQILKKFLSCIHPQILTRISIQVKTSGSDQTGKILVHQGYHKH
jgi:hypothetical protein